MPSKAKKKTTPVALQKMPTGIAGFDEITGGGLPAGRPTLVCGSAGAGKTLFSIEAIVRGATEFGEPGVIMTFEEKADELAVNVASLGFDLERLQKDGFLVIDHVQIQRAEIEETGEYDLDGLFIRLGYAIDRIGAKRVMLDTIENLFSGLQNAAVLRSELRRLFGWLKDKGVTAIITGERGDGTLTRQGLEEYVSDCVILLENRVENQISTRLLRIIKYRGTVHGTNEYPFLIDEEGLSVLPITSLRYGSEVSTQRMSTGIPSLDNMLGGQGFYRGSSTLVSGTAGTGKTSIALTFAATACKRKERTLVLAFEESRQQIIRNMLSIGLDVRPYCNSGLMQIHSARPTMFGLEMHLVSIYKQVHRFKPGVVVIDPITNLGTIGTADEVKNMLIRLLDFLQGEGITVVFTALTYEKPVVTEQTNERVSSLMDNWILVRDIESNGERNRGLYVMKARGMKHSNQVREFIIADSGLKLVDVYLGPEGVLVGSAREEQQLSEAAGAELRNYALQSKDKEISRKRNVLEAKIASLKEEFDSVQDRLNKAYIEEDLKKQAIARNRGQMARARNNRNADDGKKK